MEITKKKELLRRLIADREEERRRETGRKKGGVLSQLARIGHVSLRQAQNWVGDNDKWMPDETEQAIFAYFDHREGELVRALSPPAPRGRNYKDYNIRALASVIRETSEDLQRASEEMERRLKISVEQDLLIKQH